MILQGKPPHISCVIILSSHYLHEYYTMLMHEPSIYDRCCYWLSPFPPHYMYVINKWGLPCKANLIIVSAHHPNVKYTILLGGPTVTVHNVFSLVSPIQPSQYSLVISYSLLVTYTRQYSMSPPLSWSVRMQS